MSCSFEFCWYERNEVTMLRFNEYRWRRPILSQDRGINVSKSGGFHSDLPVRGALHTIFAGETPVGSIDNSKTPNNAWQYLCPSFR
ncbi:hypothetical protein NPIL_673521 [Nephila pilipes]|uniref:Uncharacterized protein n=1 Tax=Nephila pilipes TaxID=299642 RepID=A0A8X6MJN3_NEPPI|nr:hypothetical protein NPIL_673521 [Nephila pilipes]